VIGCVARYDGRKRLDLLIDAFSRVARNGSRVRLELIGDGPLRGHLEGQVKGLGLGDRVCLHGFEAAPEHLYPAFDIVALASDREGLPNVLLEAGAAGCAMVATAAGGAVEIVIDGMTGLLVPVNDVDALAGALGRLVADPDLRVSLGMAARRHVAEAFGMDRFVAEFATLYEDAVDRRRRKRAGRS
jgi:glycosyltransferase involved in cell wall biosynthesis